MDVNAVRRNFSLDVLRGVAILLVLARHVPGGATTGFPRAPYELGWTGVDLFFTLSGFLISNILYAELDRTGTLDVKRFLLRRGMKIWPSYFACFGLMTAAVVASNVTAGDAAAALKTLLAATPNVVFLQNYLGYQWPHSWSLAIEEHFYCVLPLVLLSLGRRGVLRRLPALLFCVCAAVLALRVGMYLAGWVRWQSYYYPTHVRVPRASVPFGRSPLASPACGFTPAARSGNPVPA
jgi:peptidoglycan/LPS O-acetylase OafA/YrhL